MKEAITVINKELREAVDGCKEGMIEGYPDLEITNIDKFLGGLMEWTEGLIVNVDRAMETMARLAKVEYEDNLGPELEELNGSQEVENGLRDPAAGFNDGRNHRRKAPNNFARRNCLQSQGEPFYGRPDPSARDPDQGGAAAAGGGGAQALSPESRGDIGGEVSRVRRDFASYVKTMRNREPGGTSQKAAQIMGAQLTSMESKIEEPIHLMDTR